MEGIYEAGGRMELSTRNQLRGTVKSVKTGTIMAEVVVDIDGQEIIAAVTRGGVEHLDLSEGDGSDGADQGDRGDVGEVVRRAGRVVFRLL